MTGYRVFKSPDYATPSGVNTALSVYRLRSKAASNGFAMRSNIGKVGGIAHNEAQILVRCDHRNPGAMRFAGVSNAPNDSFEECL